MNLRTLCDQFFGIGQMGSTIRREILGGATTFATMAYIIVVNPAILQAAGIERGPSTVATILAAVFGTLLMGLYANRPIGVAPYMGENAFIAFGLVLFFVDGKEITWQQRLGTVFVAGLVFFLLTLFRIRSWLADAISRSMKQSFAVGIGLFLFILGLYLTGIVTSSVDGLPLCSMDINDQWLIQKPAVPLKLGHLGQPAVQIGRAHV